MTEPKPLSVSDAIEHLVLRASHDIGVISGQAIRVVLRHVCDRADTLADHSRRLAALESRARVEKACETCNGSGLAAAFHNGRHCPDCRPAQEPQPAEDRSVPPEGYSVEPRRGRWHADYLVGSELGSECLPGQDYFDTEAEAVAACWAHHDAHPQPGRGGGEVDHNAVILRNVLADALGLTEPTDADLIATAQRLRTDLAAAREAVKAARQWRPIETAPRDGEIVDVALASGGIATAVWSSARGAWILNPRGPYHVQRTATHWRPRPEPPK